MPFDGLESPFNYLAKFDQVIELIETPSRWTKHTYRGPGGRYCLKEALNTVGLAEVFEPIILKAAEAVTDKEFCCVESFNDHPLTTHGDVMAVLRRTRDGIVTGRVKLPAPGAAKLAPRWHEYHVPEASRSPASLWSKLFCWN
ncbi:MAG TPA: hypothetical protein VG308_03125 [Stellaceae bacterium]|jgi:hypothetical protein|nr:hypothetical protein [Stellaceae bacterium]